jgi:hypothetical protein
MKWSKTTENICSIIFLSAIFITIGIFRGFEEALFIFVFVLFSKIKIGFVKG